MLIEKQSGTVVFTEEIRADARNKNNIVSLLIEI